MPSIIMKVERVGQTKMLWGEGPAWDARRSRLYCVDTLGAVVLWLDSEADDLVSTSVPSMVTVAHPTGDLNKLAVSLDDGFHLLDVETGDCQALAGLPAPNVPRMNDSVVDARGRIVTGYFFLGSAAGGPPPRGAYWSLGHERAWTKIDEGKGNTNGPCFSPDGKVFYVADSNASAIHAFDYDVETGALSNCRLLMDMKPLGIPDGCKVDTDGCLWSVMFGSSRLVRITPDGRHDRTVELPTSHVTDLVFAGSALDVAYVTTVGMELGKIKPEGPLAGGLLRVEGLGVTGLPEHVAQVVG